MHRGSSLTCLRLSHHLHSHPCVRSLHLDPPFLLLALPSAPFLLAHLNMKSMANLQNSAKEGVDSTDEPFLSPHVMSPRPTTSTRPQSNPACSSWTRRRSSPTKVSSADQDYDDATLEDLLHEAQRAQAYHSVREDLSVSLSSMSDRTGRPVGDRPGRPGEHRNSEAQIRTLVCHRSHRWLFSHAPSSMSTSSSSLTYPTTHREH